MSRAFTPPDTLSPDDVRTVADVRRAVWINGIFGLGAHDLQPRHLIAAYRNMESPLNVPFYYLGSQFFSKNCSPKIAELQNRLKASYPETEFMAFETEENPSLLPPEAFRLRFHSVGGYGTIATGKLLTDILAGILGLHSKSAPKYGSEKSGAPTNFYITMSPEPIVCEGRRLSTSMPALPRCCLRSGPRLRACPRSP